MTGEEVANMVFTIFGAVFGGTVILWSILWLITSTEEGSRAGRDEGGPCPPYGKCSCTLCAYRLKHDIDRLEKELGMERYDSEN